MSTSVPTMVSSSVTSSSNALALRDAITFTVAVLTPEAFFTVSLKTCLPRSEIRMSSEPFGLWEPPQSPEAITTSARLLCHRRRILSPTDVLVVEATSFTFGGLTGLTGATGGATGGAGAAATVWTSAPWEGSLLTSPEYVALTAW